MSDDPLFEFAIEAPIRSVLDPSASLSAEDLSAINRFALRPLTAADVAVFRMELCHNQPDRHFSIFPTKELSRINRLIQGKPLMELHDTSNRQPLGRFFRSSLAVDGDKTTVMPDCYVLRIAQNENAIRNIEGGVWAGTSISFAFRTAECSICHSDLRDCAHWPGKEYEVDGKSMRCHYIMHDVFDVYEGSVVPLGSQSTEFVSARAATDTGREVFDLTTALQSARDMRGTKYEKPEGPLAKRTAADDPVQAPAPRSGVRVLSEIEKDRERFVSISRILQPEYL